MQPQIQLDVQTVLEELEAAFASELAAKTRELALERAARKKLEQDLRACREECERLKTASPADND